MTRLRIDKVKTRLEFAQAGNSAENRGFRRIGPKVGRYCFARLPQKAFSRLLLDDLLKNVLRDLSEGKRPWPCLIWGETGSGKTCAGLCMADYYGGWYATLDDFTRILNQVEYGEYWVHGTHASCRVTVADYWRDWSRCSICVLDELGLRSPTDAQYVALQRAIDLREDKPLICISNHDLNGLADIYDDRIASRLACGTVHHLTGDRRTND